MLTLICVFSLNGALSFSREVSPIMSLKWWEFYHFHLITKILEPHADTSSIKVHFEQMSPMCSCLVTFLPLFQLYPLLFLNIEIR